MFPDPYYDSGTFNWDVAPDGRFLFIKQDAATSEPATNDIILIQNFDEELTRLFPDR